MWLLEDDYIRKLLLAVVYVLHAAKSEQMLKGNIKLDAAKRAA